ncbi:MAG: prephenate dehydratase [Streptosporangiaceae bacterium]
MPGVPPSRFAYLGPEGTFTEAALRTVPTPRRGSARPYPTVPAALDAVRRGEATSAMVPLENSVEGGVTATLDELAAGDPLVITREVLLPIEFALLARRGTSLADVKRIVTHPHAEAQCRRWLAARLPDAEVVGSASTAAAAMTIAAEGSAYDAALAAPIAAERYRLAVLAGGVADRQGAVTRFVLVSRPAPPPAPTGADRTSVVASITDDHPGALLEILSEFAVRGVNLTRIESRPTGEGLGRYCFSIDCEGHVMDARVEEALCGLRRVCRDVRFLGSYPRADGEPATVRRGTSDEEFRDAAAWLAHIRTGRA